MSYQRVIPRDLFNESKLLKCLGQLALIIHDGTRYPMTLEHDSCDAGFIIAQDDSTGALYCDNLSLFCAGRLIGLKSPYNDKNTYPLQFNLWEGDEGPVFTDKGQLTPEFEELLNKLVKNTAK